jgi:hypothetical protein
MKNLQFLKPSLVTLLLFISITLNCFGQTNAKQEYYELKIYRISQKAQEDRMDTYLKDVYLPALHRAGISKIGVFKPIETDTASFGKIVYVFIPYKTVDQFIQLPEVLGKDKVYTEAGKSFLDAPYNDPPFNRYETVLLRAYINMPQFSAPEFATPASERIYEIRNYESATEAKAVKKREMFNQGGEIALFKSLNFDAVFYSEVLIGSNMPNLIYMITFPDMKSHDAKWKSFGESEGWKKLSGMEEYKNTVSNLHSYLMHPTSYSDF